jgi:ParB-like nuclease domain
MHPMAIEPMPVAVLHPYPGNPRTHSKKQVRQIAESIRRFGFTNPVLIGENGEIIAGHGRVEAARLLGLECVPTVRLAVISIRQRSAVGAPPPSAHDQRFDSCPQVACRRLRFRSAAQ